MKPARIIVIVIAAVAAIGLAFVVRMMGSGQPASQAAAAPVVQQEPTTKVLVAARELKPGQRLTEEDMTWKDWPLDALNVAFFTDGSQPLPATTAKNSDKPTVALALAKSEGSLSLVLRSYADTAGPSGQAAPIAPQAAAVRVFRGGDPEVVIVQ